MLIVNVDGCKEQCDSRSNCNAYQWGEILCKVFTETSILTRDNATENQNYECWGTGPNYSK